MFIPCCWPGNSFPGNMFRGKGNLADSATVTQDTTTYQRKKKNKENHSFILVKGRKTPEKIKLNFEDVFARVTSRTDQCTCCIHSWILQHNYKYCSRHYVLPGERVSLVETNFLGDRINAYIDRHSKLKLK